jgi:GWxTD domain-containing protein
MTKKLILCVLFVLQMSIGINAQNISALLTTAAFAIPETNSCYLETYISVYGNSVVFVKNKNGKFQSEISFAVSFEQKDEIKNAQKYNLLSPEVDDTTKSLPNFIDQQRYTLEPGYYTMVLEISDKNNPKQQVYKSKTEVTVPSIVGKLAFSDIQLLESFTKASTVSAITKCGYDLVPYVATYFPENSDKIKFYVEVYNASAMLGQNEKILFTYYIQSYEKKSQLSEYSGFQKQTTNKVNVLLTELNIKDLPSGNYELVIELRDKENKYQSGQKLFFQRRNKKAALTYDDLKSIDVGQTFVKNYTNTDTLKEYIRCLRPISGTSDVMFSQNQLNSKDLLLMQQYFYNFWRARDPLEPELAWFTYYKEVMKVNKEFGTYGLKGYDTHRGRVYLQYGPPTSRSHVDDLTSCPYEIWLYDVMFDKTYQLTGEFRKQTNRRFVFHNPDRVSNKYYLLHSDAKGEKYDSKWEIHLCNPGNGTTPGGRPISEGDKADELFRNPR